MIYWTTACWSVEEGSGNSNDGHYQYCRQHEGYCHHFERPILQNRRSDLSSQYPKVERRRNLLVQEQGGQSSSTPVYGLEEADAVVDAVSVATVDLVLVVEDDDDDD